MDSTMRRPAHSAAMLGEMARQHKRASQHADRPLDQDAIFRSSMQLMGSAHQNRPLSDNGYSVISRKTDGTQWR